MLGGGFSIGEVPPLDPDAKERWWLNNVPIARFAGTLAWTRGFDLHPTAHIQATRPDAYAWQCQQTGTCPIYRFVDDPAGPAFVRYPVERVKKAFPSGARRFAGSLSWMLALALVERFDVIDLFWWPFHDHEHARQIPAVLYWLGRAEERGVRITIHGDSALKPSGPLYGLEAI